MISYFDNCATTKVDAEIMEILTKYATEVYYNPSARSTFCLNVANDLNEARFRIAKLLGAESDEIFFTSGGTESDNLAILGSVRAKHGNVVVTASEHSAVYNSVMELKNRGLEVRLANVLADGHIDVADFLSKIDGETQLAVFMHVNNETGAINDVAKINKAVKTVNPRTLTFSDGVQAVGKIPVNIKNLGVDMYSFSGHKIHGSKGTGVLFVKKSTHVAPIIFGGGQEKGVRSGTEYVGGQIALATALQNAVNNLSENTVKFAEFRKILLDALSKLDGVHFNCTRDVAPNIFSVAFSGIKGEVLVHMLENYEIIIGTGSACSSKQKMSRVAKAMNVADEFAEGMVRISFSKYNTLDEVKNLAEKLVLCVNQLRKTMNSGFLG